MAETTAAHLLRPWPIWTALGPTRGAEQFGSAYPTNTSATQRLVRPCRTSLAAAEFCQGGSTINGDIDGSSLLGHRHFVGSSHSTVVALPMLATLISLACALMIGRDARRRPSPDKIAWLIAFALFTVAAGSEVAGSLLGWSATLVQVYYLTGATLVVGFLGLGELYLLAPKRIAKTGPGVALFMTAVAAALVLEAPVDLPRLPTDGWHALERGPALVAVTVAINSLGTALVVGGAAFSAWQFWRRGIFRHRMMGCLLIAAGTLVVASGGTLTRLGQPAYLYLAMAVGVSIIFAGYLEARRRETPTTRPALRDADLQPLVASADEASAVNGRGGLPSTGDPATSEPAVAFLVGIVSLAPGEVADRCAFWSVDPEPITRFDRLQARRVWSVRLRLPASAQAALDGLPAATQLQVADLYLEVLAAGGEASETVPTRLPPPGASERSIAWTPQSIRS